MGNPERRPRHIDCHTDIVAYRTRSNRHATGSAAMRAVMPRVERVVHPVMLNMLVLLGHVMVPVTLMDLGHGR
jgi:hypothetical protein